MRKTQLVTTIGPASDSEEGIKQLLLAGMNIARFNTKHNVPAWHQERIQRVRKVAQELGQSIKILLDLQGPEVRIRLPREPAFEMKKGDLAYFTSDEQAAQDPRSVIIPSEVTNCLDVGNHIILEDGMCELVVKEKHQNMLIAEALDDFWIRTAKTMNTPGVVLEMPSLLPKDIDFLENLQHDGVDYVGLSFVRDTKDIQILRDELKKRNMASQVIAKIENQKALDNIHDIIDASDGIMIARGDLAVEIPYYQVPYWQKYIIKECNKKFKFVITATQMLLTMMERPRPSRAEVADVANAVLDGTNAVMLSEESAMGKYPTKAVETQAKIVEYYEQYVTQKE